MKVADFMTQSVVWLNQDDSAMKAVKIIYNIGLKSVPVLKDRKLVGIITEETILRHLFPSVKEYMDDKRVRDFSAMEENIHAMLKETAKKIMRRDVVTITQDAPLMKAQSLMVLHNVSRLPVIDDAKKLIGIISQGDILKALVTKDIPRDTNEEFHEWSSKFHEVLVSMRSRVEVEVHALHNVFQKYNSYRILDLFCGAGQHDIALAEEGYDVFGINKYELFHKQAAEHHKKLPEQIQNRLAFTRGNYDGILGNKKEDFDAAIMTGNALAHHPDNWDKVIRLMNKCLVKKNAVIFLQIANFEKILKEQHRFQNFTLSQSKLSKMVEYAFVEYYDPPRKGSDTLTLTISVSSYQRHRWRQVGINSTPIAYITQPKIDKLLTQCGFNKIKYYGSTFLKNPLKDKFDIHQHDWMNVLAIRT